MERGTICKIIAGKGFGFLKPDDPGARDLFFHVSAFRIRQEPFDDLLIDRRVEYRLVTMNGKTRAEDLVFID